MGTELTADKPRILVVDDDRSICKLMGSMLEMEAYPHKVVSSSAAARKAIHEDRFDILISDIYLGDESGLDLLELMKQQQPDAEVVIMTAHGSVETAVQAVRHGAFDYVSKPFSVDEILGVIQRIEEKQRAFSTPAIGFELSEAMPETEIIGTTPEMVAIYKKVARVARIDSPALILGESGVGKELVARAIHRHGPRFAGAFAVINCGALPETLLESELFGHEKGAFTGAVASRRGLLESAVGGTVFLDEIAETSLQFQVKLLRVIQEREVRRLGTNETFRVNIRLLAATNRDLKEMVRSNQFREDLFHRLNVFTISVPPLRERRPDIPVLASHFLKEFCGQAGKTVGLATDAVTALQAYHWPGNVRELRNVIERAVTFCDTNVIQASDLELGDEEEVDDDRLPGLSAPATTGSLDEMEKEHILKVLGQTGGNKKRAAEILGIERRTLYNKAKRLGIDF